MAGKRKAEGIALLSLYNDDDDEPDREDEDETDDDEQKEDAAATTNAEESAEEEGEMESEGAIDMALDILEQVAEELVDLPQDMVSPPMASLADERGTTYNPAALPPPQPPPAGASSMGHGIFVDYEHDEPTLSPEAEEGEIMSMGRAVLGIDIQVSNGVVRGVTPPTSRVRILTPDGGLPGVLDRGAVNQLEDPSQQLKGILANDLAAKQDEFSIAGGAATASSVLEATSVNEKDAEAPDADPLADFLPPPPITKCSEELQLKFSKYLALKNAGRSFNETLRKSKGYRNPDFLQRAVKYQEIDQIGSCFRKEIFDPHGYDPSDFYDALAAELKREQERKEQAKKQSQRIDFAHGGVQPAPGSSTSMDKTRPILPALGGQNAVAVPAVNTSTTGSQVLPAASDVALKADGRSSKKSKWDKVDSDGRGVLPLPPVAKTNMVTNASAHAALLTANAGAGYASFAQQKRKEAEERSKVMDKKSEKK